MSYEDPRSRDRGAYTPPTDDDLPLHRGGFDARRGAPAKAPATLLISLLVLAILVVIILWMVFNGGFRKAGDVPPAIGTPVTQMKSDAPLEAQPVDPEADIGVYRDTAEAPDAAPTYAPPPEVVQPRPAPQPIPTPVPTPSPAAPAATTTPAPKVVTPAPATPATPATTAATGTSAVQIGAFSSTAIADQQYASVAGRFPQFARGAGKRVQSVTAANGSTVFRTTFTGLSRERAQAFCAAIRAGGGDCLVR